MMRLKKNAVLSKALDALASIAGRCRTFGIRW